MEVFRGSWSGFTDVRDSVVTVGFFDGVHLGHGAILRQVTESARAQSLRSVVLTFNTHPRNILNRNAPPVPLLSTLDEKLALLSAAGLDLVLVLDFDQGLSQMTAHDFVQIVLRGRVGMKRIVIGFNHGFGRNRLGDRETLIAMSKTLGFAVDVVNPTRVEDTIISSSYLRTVIAEGNVGKAAVALGRWYTVRGVVVHGFHRGKRLRWPTANVGHVAPEKLCPGDGIYAGWARIQNVVYPAAICNGFNPTFPEHKHSLEAHLIGFDRNIYDEEIELAFVERIRSEKQFASEEELSLQIADDVRTAQAILATERAQPDAPQRVRAETTKPSS